MQFMVSCGEPFVKSLMGRAGHAPSKTSSYLLAILDYIKVELAAAHISAR